ncbi:MAG TPA: PEP-CTERM sorting domain-containing protein [Methylomirabilota bacterium]|nr:PEP-CTERM sorting domain-containing protein [Methylomirabilota bacterium]
MNATLIRLAGFLFVFPRAKSCPGASSGNKLWPGRNCVAVVCAWLAMVAAAHAQGTIFFQTLDLADSTPGQDLWQYTFRVADRGFTSGQGFSVFFDEQLYRALQNPGPLVNPEWSVLVVQPDLVLPDAGFFDAQAMQNAPSLSAEFSVQFVWLGEGAPGAQPFTIYDTDYSTLVSGFTVVPEPTSLGLLVAGLLAWAGWRGMSRVRRPRR